MTHTVRIAVNMQPVSDASGALSWKAALPMGVLFEKSLDRDEVERERADLEVSYRTLVETLVAKRHAFKADGVMSYWEFGDALVQFENARAQQILFVDRLPDHLVRDVAFSYTMIMLCRRFRERIPDLAQVDPNQSFTNYQRAGFDPQRLAGTIRRRGRPRKKVAEV